MTSNQSGRKTGAKKPKMIKSVGIRCAVCGRPLARAAALMRGMPVGPICAVASGLAEARGVASQAISDSFTLDLFATNP